VAGNWVQHGDGTARESRRRRLTAASHALPKHAALPKHGKVAGRAARWTRRMPRHL